MMVGFLDAYSMKRKQNKDHTAPCGNPIMQSTHTVTDRYPIGTTFTFSPRKAGKMVLKALRKKKATSQVSPAGPGE